MSTAHPWGNLVPSDHLLPSLSQQYQVLWNRSLGYPRGGEGSGVGSSQGNTGQGKEITVAPETKVMAGRKLRQIGL